MIHDVHVHVLEYYVLCICSYTLHVCKLIMDYGDSNSQIFSIYYIYIYLVICHETILLHTI